MRLAGTAIEYSINASAQLTRIARQIGTLGYSRCQYQAVLSTTFDRNSSNTVSMVAPRVDRAARHRPDAAVRRRVELGLAWSRQQSGRAAPPTIAERACGAGQDQSS